MRIVCDRCRKNTVDYGERKDWKHIEVSEKGYGKLWDFYFCKECSNAFFDFLNNKAGEQE